MDELMDKLAAEALDKKYLQHDDTVDNVNAEPSFFEEPKKIVNIHMNDKEEVSAGYKEDSNDLQLDMQEVITPQAIMSRVKITPLSLQDAGHFADGGRSESQTTRIERVAAKD